MAVLRGLILLGLPAGVGTGTRCRGCFGERCGNRRIGVRGHRCRGLQGAALFVEARPRFTGCRFLDVQLKLQRLPFDNLNNLFIYFCTEGFWGFGVTHQHGLPRLVA